MIVAQNIGALKQCEAVAHSARRVFAGVYVVGLCNECHSHILHARFHSEHVTIVGVRGAAHVYSSCKMLGLKHQRHGAPTSQIFQCCCEGIRHSMVAGDQSEGRDVDKHAAHQSPKLVGPFLNAIDCQVHTNKHHIVDRVSVDIKSSSLFCMLTSKRCSSTFCAKLEKAFDLNVDFDATVGTAVVSLVCMVK